MYELLEYGFLKNYPDKSVDIFNEIVKGEYKVLSGQVYTGTHGKIKLIHYKCGEEWCTSFTNLLNVGKRELKTECKKCKLKERDDKQRHSLESLKQIIDSKFEHGKEYTLSGTYVDTNTKITATHICGHSYEVRPRELTMGNKCPVCSKLVKSALRSFDLEKFINSLKVDRPNIEDLYDFSNSVYTKTDNKLEVVHKKCNKIWSVRPREMKSGNECPYCNTQSKGERELLEFIQETCKLHNITVKEKVRGILDPKLEFDVYIPELKLAIEYNGEYWHQEATKQDKDFKKFKLAEEKGIRIICIFESEWRNKQELVKSKLLHIIHASEKPSLYARKCEVYDISDLPAIKNKFLEENHIQGKDRSNYAYGLYYGEELVSVMTFIKARKSMNGNANYLELSRFANSNKYKIPGAFSKLFKRFISCNDLSEFSHIITYANLRYSYGNVYLESGFEFSHQTKPNYWYFKRAGYVDKLIYRYNFTKQKIEELYKNKKTDNEGKIIITSFDPTKTEKQNMDDNNYGTVLDYGNYVFLYKL